MVLGADFRGCSRVQEAKAQGMMVPFEGFRAEFESRVTSIGHLLAMMAPWDCPVYVTRVRAEPLCASWCLAEPICVCLSLLVAHHTLPVLDPYLCWQPSRPYPHRQLIVGGRYGVFTSSSQPSAVGVLSLLGCLQPRQRRCGLPYSWAQGCRSCGKC